MGLSKKLFENEVAHLEFRAYLRHRLNGGKISAPPVFIVGCGHSGTTMLRHVLGMHAALYAVPYESRMFFHSRSKIHLADRIWSFTAISQGKTRWVEKTPAHIHQMDRILRTYPESKVLLLIRDGRSVAVSLRKRWGNFERSVQRWVDDNRAGEPYWNHPRVMKLSYERLVADFENQIRAICDFICEPFDDRLLKFSDKSDGSPDDGEIAPADGERPKELRGRQMQKGLYNAEARWMSQMTDEEKALFRKMAGEMLISYGYAVNMDW